MTEPTLTLDQLAQQIAKQYPKKEDLFGEEGVQEGSIFQTVSVLLEV